MALHGEAGVPLDAPERRLELVVGEGLDTPALVADDMVMVIVRELDALVVSPPVTQVDLLHEVLLGEQVDDAIDARNADLAPLGS